MLLTHVVLAAPPVSACSLVYEGRLGFPWIPVGSLPGAPGAPSCTDTSLGMTIAAVSRNRSAGLGRNCLWKHLVHISVYEISVCFLLLETSFKLKEKRLFNIMRSLECLTTGRKSCTNTTSRLHIDTWWERNSTAPMCKPLLTGHPICNSSSSQFHPL